jgi:hypothetical protein
VADYDFYEKSRERKRIWRARYVSAEDDVFTLGVRQEGAAEQKI